jgi:hypothetical protein
LDAPIRMCDMLDVVLDEHWPLFLLGSDEM